jgi:hypothetical protein
MRYISTRMLSWPEAAVDADVRAASAVVVAKERWLLRRDDGGRRSLGDELEWPRQTEANGDTNPPVRPLLHTLDAANDLFPVVPPCPPSTRLVSFAFSNPHRPYIHLVSAALPFYQLQAQLAFRHNVFPIRLQDKENVLLLTEEAPTSRPNPS